MHPETVQKYLPVDWCTYHDGKHYPGNFCPHIPGSKKRVTPEHPVIFSGQSTEFNPITFDRYPKQEDVVVPNIIPILPAGL